VALAAGWYLHGVTVADDRRPYTEVWTDADQRTAALYVEDDLLGAAYVDLKGDAAETWAESLRAQIPVLAPQEIVAWTALVEDPAERIQAVGHLAAVAPEAPRDVVVDVLARLAADPSRPSAGRCCTSALASPGPTWSHSSSGCGTPIRHRRCAPTPTAC